MSQINNLSILKTWLICYTPVRFARVTTKKLVQFYKFRRNLGICVMEIRFISFFSCNSCNSWQNPTILVGMLF